MGGSQTRSWSVDRAKLPLPPLPADLRTYPLLTPIQICVGNEAIVDPALRRRDLAEQARLESLDPEAQRLLAMSIHCVRVADQYVMNCPVVGREFIGATPCVIVEGRESVLNTISQCSSSAPVLSERSWLLLTAKGTALA